MRSRVAVGPLRGLHGALGQGRQVGQPQIAAEQLRFPPGLPEELTTVDVDLPVEVVHGGGELGGRLARGPGLGHLPLQRAGERRRAVRDRVADRVVGGPLLREGTQPGHVAGDRHGGGHVGDLLLEATRGRNRDRSRVAELIPSGPGLEEVGHLVEEHPGVQQGREGLGLEERGGQGGHRLDLPADGRPPDVGIGCPGSDLVRGVLDLAGQGAHERAHLEPGLVDVHRHRLGPAVDPGSTHGDAAADGGRHEGDPGGSTHDRVCGHDAAARRGLGLGHACPLCRSTAPASGSPPDQHPTVPHDSWSMRPRGARRSPCLASPSPGGHALSICRARADPIATVATPSGWSSRCSGIPRWP